MKRALAILTLALFTSACQELGPAAPEIDAPAMSVSGSSPEAYLTELAGVVNAALEARGEAYRLDHAEWLSSGNAVGTTVFFRDVGNRQLPADWVPGDPRRGGGTNITYRTDQFDGATSDGVTPIPIAMTTAAINRATQTWENVTCSTIPLTGLANIPGLDLGVVEFFFTPFGGFPAVVADITHAGWIPLAPGILGVTFTFVFIAPPDLDANGKPDTAFREIYYNLNAPWGINTVIPFDVETVALHEIGHGLSQDHFGMLFRTDANGKFHFAPRAVMNAAYTGVQQNIGRTDNAGHCSLWGSWPSN